MSQTEKRKQLAQNIANGLAGWYQFQLSQGFGDFFGEDSAQLMALQILSAQVGFDLKPSHPFAGHESDQARLDIALFARGEKKTSYGAIEIKWLGLSTKASTQTRVGIISDALRLSVVASTNMKANLLVVGGLTKKFDSLFSVGTNQHESTKESRELFAKLFKQPVDKPENAAISELSRNFGEVTKKLPKTASLSDQDKLQVTLLATADAADYKSAKAGCVSVWLCLKSPGRKSRRATA